ncbi:hypothetical protein KP509_18G051300 [Ceratopteris richardii]|uniref:Dolichyl-diphosphooligosaccharide--protein glycosyltransferase subunit 2 n=1 Tax=Ceratopteris richardii TaxID=49495 RepID=A0A8T2SPL9_CERRI|nr:hypothetical protein KP509_18G051300 [Ceratopteris richardii]KAH7365885.1 hypothetical protein KP509_18G051300 [Ceratopteris richardii]KAH7365886.1 hypothetical protein KP509_18G051300 [Ceratopteris richardii]
MDSCRNGCLILALVALLCLSVSASPNVLSEADKKFGTELLIKSEGSVSTLEEKYQLLRSFQVLGIRREELITCSEVEAVLMSSTSVKDLFYASKCGETLLCSFQESALKTTVSRLLSSLDNTEALLDIHFSLGTLAFLKVQFPVALNDPVSIFQKIKVLSAEDGSWKYNPDDAGTSAKAAGTALETMGDLISLAGQAFDDAKIRYLKGVASKLFEFLEKYDDGTQFIDERPLDGLYGGGGPLAATSQVVKGVAVVASHTSGHIEVPAERVISVAKFFLTAGIHGSLLDMFHVLDGLGVLDKNRFLVPVILSVRPSVLSLSAKEVFKISTTTVLGSPVSATITLRKAVRANEKEPFLLNQVLESDETKGVHNLNDILNKLDIGSYDLTFKVKILEEGRYATEPITIRRVLVTGVASIPEVEVGVLDSDTGSTDYVKRWNPMSKEVVSLYATHLQKLYFGLDILSPRQEQFIPHQAFLKLKHETKVEHLFLLKPSGKKLELSLNLLGLVEKLNYLSGIYTIDLIVGDVAMENPVMWNLGTVELDLPEPPEGKVKLTSQAESPFKYGPRPEITHMFRPAEKRAPPTLSNTFLALTLVPLLGFLVGLKLLNTNMKNFPSSGLPVLAALLFHLGIGSILGLYALFWLKLNLFQTLKLLALLGTVLTVPGYYILSHLADASAPKVKSA